MVQKALQAGCTLARMEEQEVKNGEEVTLAEGSDF
jgi:hypothetical protein